MNTPSQTTGTGAWIWRLLALGAIALGLLWCAYQAAGPACVARLHDGPVPSVLEPVHARLSALPADYCRDRADALFALALRTGVLAWTLMLVAACAWPARCGPSPRTAVQRACLWGGGALVILAPWLWLKLAGLALALRFVLPEPRTLVIDAARMRRAWFALLLAAYVCAPYWALPETLWARLAALAALALGGWWWAGLAAAELRVNLPATRWSLPALALAGMALIWPAGAVIPWMGDEDYHIMQVAFLCENLPPVWMATLAALAMLALGRAFEGRRAAVWMVAAAALAGAGYPHFGPTLARYPFLARWAEAAPVQALYPFPTLFYQESLVRTSSVLCAIAIGILTFLAMHSHRRRGVAVAIAVLTVPIMAYYGTLVCLEMPALVALTLAALRGPALLARDPDRVRGDPGWLGLVLAAFMKETVLPVIAAFAVCRAWTWWTLRRRERGAWQAELRLVAVVAAPLVIYLVFRAGQDVFRGYPANWRQWFRIDLWGVMLGSLWEQLGLLTALAVAGTVALRRWWSRALLWWWAWLAAAMLFSLGDTAGFVGYSRYNLFLIPPLIAIVVLWLTHTRSAHLLIAAWLVSNQLLSPLLSEGQREPGWGTPLAEVSEYYFPYDDALAWIQAEHPDARILHAGVNYPYYFDFYFKQFRWHPDVVFDREASTLEAAARAARAARCTLILFHVPEDAPRIAVHAPGFRVEALFELTGSTLAVYGSAPDEPAR